MDDDTKEKLQKAVLQFIPLFKEGKVTLPESEPLIGIGESEENVTGEDTA